MPEFRWNSWNVEHIAQHGIEPGDAEFVVRYATRPFPSYQGSGKWLVRGQTESGRYIQVIYVVDPDETLFVIHARPLKIREKRNLKRRRR